MNMQHQQLSHGRWQKLSFFEQMANIGSEVNRVINWQNKGRPDYAHQAFERALELFDLTVEDEKNKQRLKEILRAREIFADYFVGGNNYHSLAKDWQNYFLAFNFAARRTL
jgi:hypothetical protein